MEGVLGTDKEAIPLEIPDLDVFVVLEVCLCRALPLLMIFSGSATGVVGGLS
jgi:hypothetical protein